MAGIGQGSIDRVEPVLPRSVSGVTGRQGGHVVGLQRRRLLSATVELVYEGGVRALTVATVCGRAGVSRRTFYDIFEEREDCVHAAFEDAVEQATLIVERAAGACEGWREKVRAGLAGLLWFLDREPGLGRLLIVDALGSGERTLDARRRVLARLSGIVDRGRIEGGAEREPPPLTAEGTVGAVFSVIHARMLERDSEPLIGLCGTLMAMIVYPYLGPAAARSELERPADADTHQRLAAPRLPADPFKDLPVRLTYRTARVLCSIAAAPGASSKQIASASGITDAGQTSRLLTRLQRHGLIHDNGIGPAKGMAKAWTLTNRGEDILHATGQL